MHCYSEQPALLKRLYRRTLLYCSFRGEPDFVRKARIIRSPMSLLTSSRKLGLDPNPANTSSKPSSLLKMSSFRKPLPGREGGRGGTQTELSSACTVEKRERSSYRQVIHNTSDILGSCCLKRQSLHTRYLVCIYQSGLMKDAAIHRTPVYGIPGTRYMIVQ